MASRKALFNDKRQPTNRSQFAACKTDGTLSNTKTKAETDKCLESVLLVKKRSRKRMNESFIEI